MIDFRSLDRETRTVALVGRFLQLWASLETAIGNAIGTALRLNRLQEYVLTRNISFLNKTYILGALCHAAKFKNDDLKTSRDLLQQIRDFYSNRNIIAHEMFTECQKTDGVEFLVMKARGKIYFPDVQWSVEHFEVLFLALINFAMRVNDLNKVLLRERGGLGIFSHLADLGLSEPTEELPAIGSLGLLIRQPQADHTSGTTSASPETDPEIPPSPEE